MKEKKIGEVKKNRQKPPTGVTYVLPRQRGR